MEYLLCLSLFGVGLYAVIVKRHMLKIIIGVAIMGYALNLFLVLVGYRYRSDIPIAAPGATVSMVDPLMQAVVLSTIIVGLAVTIILAALAVRLYEVRGTMDVEHIRDLNG